MKIELTPISQVKANTNNPRIIKDDKFKKLVKSIQDFPKMLDLRPIVVNDDMVVLGGNMRLKACKEAGLKEVPVIKASELTEDEQRQFIIKDNVGFGEWDWDTLANEWNAEQLDAWGLDVPVWNDKEENVDLSNFNKSAESYLNNTIRQIVLQYDVETHKLVLEKLSQICDNFAIEKDNSTALLKLIRFYEDN